MAMIGGERNLHWSCPSTADKDGICLKGAPGIDHFIAVTSESTNELTGYLDRTRAKSEF